MTDESTQATDRSSTRKTPWRTAALAGSALLCIAIWACYLVQPDILAPVIIVPAWCWLLPGVALMIKGYNAKNRLWTVGVLAVWVAFAAVFVEEAHSLVRMQGGPSAEWSEARQRGRGLRVVSLNCYVGQIESAREVAAWKPDVVLLQESPSRQQVAELSHELFGDSGVFLHGGDTSILTSGQIQPKTPSQTRHFTHASVLLPSGLETDVISVRLAPPVFRMDFWSPGFWADHRDKRKWHRAQIAEVMRSVHSIPPAANVIIGGDFNSPPSDDALATMHPRLVDSFRQAGRGWGNTGTSNYPLFRVDQVWISGAFRAESVIARRTIHSDHKMVVCDLMLDR